MTANGKVIDITPDTRVGELLDTHPDLEAVLIRMAPAFGRLSNPVLRKTVARIATLRQAAAVGGVSLPGMISELRHAAGYQETSTAAQEAAGEAGERPSWYRPECVVESLDGRPMLNRGEPPIGPVLKGLGRLAPGQCFELITPFLPAPLVDVAKKQGYEAWWIKKDDLYRTYFTRPASSARLTG